MVELWNYVGIIPDAHIPKSYKIILFLSLHINLMEDPFLYLLEFLTLENNHCGASCNGYFI